MTSSLKDKRILLTGVSRGVGLATARLLLKGGATLLGVARDPARLETATAELVELAPGKFSSLCVTLESPEAGAKIASAIEDAWGAVDIVVHNAGVQLHHPDGICSEPEGILERSMDINLYAPFRITRALLPLLRKGREPRLLNVGSGAGTIALMGDPGIASYRLSKWAVNGLTMLQAKELEGVISVNAFDPGWVRTDLGGEQAPGTPEEAAEGMVKTLCLPWSVTGKFFKDGKEIPW